MLIVEDDPGSRTALGYVLAHAGHDVATAATLAEAMRHLSDASAPDLIILDLMLPDGDGCAVLQSVRASPPPHPRVAVTTGVMDAAWLARVEALRPDALLRKPIRMDELMKLLA